MTSLHLLHLTERPTQAERQILAHAQAGDHIGFPSPVAVLGDRREGHTNKPFVMEKLGEEIDMQRLYPVVEDNDPIAVMADFTYRSGHVTSLRVTMDGLNSLRIAV
jgi:hypothetical protein